MRTGLRRNRLFVILAVVALLIGATAALLPVARSWQRWNSLPTATTFSRPETTYIPCTGNNQPAQGLCPQRTVTEFTRLRPPFYFAPDWDGGARALVISYAILAGLLLSFRALRAHDRREGPAPPT